MASPNWSLFFVAAILIGCSPGASNFVAFTNGLSNGFVKGAFALCGRFCAFLILVSVVAVGVGSAITQSFILGSIIKWCGIIYLVFLSWRLWTSLAMSGQLTVGRQAYSARSLVCREFTVAMLNPKAVLIFTAFLPQFVVGKEGIVLQLFQLSLAYIFIELLAASLYALLGSRVGAASISGQTATIVNRITAGMMLGAAIWLAVAKI